MVNTVNAVDLARAAGIDPKRFRHALRDANLPWHGQYERWIVTEGGPEHQDMERVLSVLLGVASGDGRAPSELSPTGNVRGKSSSDEHWVIDLCDHVLNRTAIRQHRFPFLRGDPGPSGASVSLPVDAFYPDLSLVVEYNERQHSTAVPFFDKRATISGVSRSEQRRRYDQRRREVLPKHGLRLIVFDYSEFDCERRGRLIRDADAYSVIEARLQEFR